MFHVGPCPICGNGLRGVRVCCGRPVVICDECDAVWATPDVADRISASSDPPCGQCSESLWGKQAHWAGQEEVTAAGWWTQVQGETPPRSTSNQSRKPNNDAIGMTAAPDHNGSLVLILSLLLVGSVVAALTVL